MQRGSIQRSRGLIRKGPFARLWWSSAISSLGDWITLFATFSLAAHIAGEGPGSTIAILVPLTARILPGMLIGIIGGVAADRIDRKRTMIVADVGRAVLVLGLIFVQDFQTLFIAAFAIEVLSLMRQPAREAVVPNLVEPRQLVAANSLTLVSAYGTAPIGSAAFAAIAAVVARSPGIPDASAVDIAFGLDAVSFALSALIVVTIPIWSPAVPPERKRRGGFDLRAPFKDLTHGVKFVAAKRSIRRVVLGIAVALFGGGVVFVLGQPFSTQVVGAGNTGYGILATALGLGVAAGMAGSTAWASDLERREPLFAAALTLAGFSVLMGSLTITIFGASGWIFAGGIGTGVAYVMGFTHLHEQVTDDIRGRTFAAQYAVARFSLLLSFGVAGLGAVVLDGILPGLLSSGIRLTLLLAGSVILIGGLLVLWAVRSQLPGLHPDEAAYETLKDASETFGMYRGDRRRRDDQDDQSEDPREDPRDEPGDSKQDEA